jgi:23S rRNA (pseudouridine1915-N3)-methyltransferase
MNIKLIFIGKENAEYLQDAINQYISKIKFYNSFEVVAIPYLKNSKSMTEEEQKKKEGAFILKKIYPQDFVVLLDEQGKEQQSVAFAQYLQQQFNTSKKNLIFIIGGAYGFSKDVYMRANDKLSFSKMTFPHLLTRLIFIEQLYRAFTILRNEPYHHI